jgi:OPA family sugar phosphate sensor protein UhpC-like MFS transporter
LTKNVSQFFSRRERGIVMGWWSTNYALGGVIASFVAGYFGEKYGWRWAFYAPALVLAGVLILFWMLQRNRPQDVGLMSIEEYHGEPPDVLQPGETPQEIPEGSWRTIGETLTNPMVLLLCAVYFLLKPARYAILLWGPKYVNARLGTGMIASGALSATFELAGPVGALLAGYVSDKLFASRRVPVCVISLAALGVCLVLLNFVPARRGTLAAGLFVVGIMLFAADTVVAGTAAVDFGTRKGASTASGVINGVGSIGAIIGGTVPGFFNKRWGWGGVFGFLGAMAFLAGIILIPRWNAMPPQPRASKIPGNAEEADSNGGKL